MNFEQLGDVRVSLSTKTKITTVKWENNCEDLGDGTEFHGNSLNFPFSFSVSLKLCFENDIGYLKKKIKDGRREWKCHHGIKPRTPVVWFPLSLSCPKTSLSLHFRASYHEGRWWGHDQHKPPEIKADKEGKVRSQQSLFWAMFS